MKFYSDIICFAYGYPDWTHKYHHAGFDISANRVMEILEEYMDENHDMQGDICFWVTGHSMGAGVANIVAAELLHGHSGINNRTDNVYCYTFASPNTFYLTDNVYTTDSVVHPGKKIQDTYREPHGTKYRCIFNIVNDDDFVPKLPMKDCGWTRYGRTAKKSCNLLKKRYNGYNNYPVNNSGVSSTRFSNSYKNYLAQKYFGNNLIVEDNIIKEFTKIFLTNNMREESYRYSSYSEFEYKYLTDGNHSICKNAAPYQYTDENYVVENIDSIAGLPKNRGNTKVYVQYQMPAYIFQVIANAMHEKDDDGNKAIFDGLMNKAKLKFFLTSKHYNIARDKLVEYNNYINYPHYLESYFALTKEINVTDFR